MNSSRGIKPRPARNAMKPPKGVRTADNSLPREVGRIDEIAIGTQFVNSQALRCLRDPTGKDCHDPSLGLADRAKVVFLEHNMQTYVPLA